MRQGSNSSLALSNVYQQKLVEKALVKSRSVVVEGERIKSIKYTDDQAIAIVAVVEIYYFCIH